MPSLNLIPKEKAALRKIKHRMKFNPEMEIEDKRIVELDVAIGVRLMI